MSTYKAQNIFRGRNGMLFFMAALCLYFSYYSVYGDRSFSRLKSLENETHQVDIQLEAYSMQVSLLQGRVKAMRPGSVDKDLLEERVRYMLGYRGADEWDIL
tara:strand:- start:514417 stop:514722 length:306 start_codon:yes stop_codon:yes gene_type:complete